MITHADLLAVFAFGFGLSLALYRLIATRNRWPMGYVQEHLPLVAVLLGLFALFAGIVHAADAGFGGHGLPIVILGALLSVGVLAWLRVGSQISLFLAPVAGALLVMSWVGFPV